MASNSNTCKIDLIVSGYEKYNYTVDKEDLQFCLSCNIVTQKPPCIPNEFAVLAYILMQEENLGPPGDCQSALALYLRLLSLIQ